MEVFYHELPFPHVIIRDYYNKEELDKVWLELNFLTSCNIMQPPKKTGSAMSPDGEVLKQNHGVFLDGFYSKRESSNILTLSRKHYNHDLLIELEKQNFIFRYLVNSTKDSTLVSYYEESDNYPPHTDQGCFTSITWLYKDPKRFTGGNFVFNEYEYEIPLQNNCMVIFPSIMLHSVTPVTMDVSMDSFSGFGRYSITNFITV
jgi:hypothetical protein